MIYVCIPSYNEAATVGLVLWKVRQVFTRFAREYQLLVCDDGSTDATAEVLASYARVLPLEVIPHRERSGYARSLEALLLRAVERTDRPKRDCAVTIHADFAHQPEVLEDLVKRVESGADVVVADTRRGVGSVPRWFGLLRRAVPRLLGMRGVPDPISGLCAFRLVTLKHAFRDATTGHLLQLDGWCASAELVARAARHARRLETVTDVARYDRRRRASRCEPWRQTLQAWQSRRTVRGLLSASVAILALVVGAAAAGRAQQPADSTAPPAAPTSVRRPYGIGESMTYSAKFGMFNVGQAALSVVGLDTVRGVETYRVRFHLKGGALWYRLDQLMESWFGVADGLSRRFVSDQHENDRERHRSYEIFPDSGFYREAGRDSTIATVAEPIDEATFFFLVRTLPLEIGQRYELQRYFRPDRNPITLIVLGRENMEVYGRRVPCLVVRAIIVGRGIFAERNDTRMWLTDDERRLMVQFRSRFSFGTVTLRLQQYLAPRAPRGS